MPQVAVNQKITPPASLIRSASGMIPGCSRLLLASLVAPGCSLLLPGSSQATVAAPRCSKLLAGLRETTMRLVPPRVRRKTKNGAKRTYLDHCTHP